MPRIQCTKIIKAVELFKKVNIFETQCSSQEPSVVSQGSTSHKYLMTILRRARNHCTQIKYSDRKCLNLSNRICKTFVNIVWKHPRNTSQD